MKVVCGLLAALFGILSVVGGVGVSLGGLAYGIWTIIAAFQTSTVTFWIVFKAILFLMGSGLAGLLTFFLMAFLASIFGSIATD